MAERVALAADGEPCAFELGLDLLKQRPMSERIPSGRAARGGHGMQGWPVDEFRPAVEQHSANRWLWILGDRVENGSFEVDDVIHNYVCLLVGLLVSGGKENARAIT
jgi:hypothetical protein